MEPKEKRRGLGRGLSALMADVEASGGSPTISGSSASSDRNIPIESIHPNIDQPRRQFDEEALRDLTQSIEQRGVLQPLLVRPHPTKHDNFEIVAGERRWRAAQRAAVHELPVIVRDFTDSEVLEVAIVENVQRADLNPVEEATGYRQLMERFGHTQEQVAQALGKSRSHIANLLRLLSLPEPLLDHLRAGRLSMGHARALLTADDPAALAQKVMSSGLSVRETERLAKSKVPGIGGASPSRKKPAIEKDADTKALENDLSAHLGMRVEITHMPGTDGGTISLAYRDFDQLDELCRLLSQTN